MTPRGVTLRFRGRMAEKLLDKALAEGVRFRAVERVGERELVLTTDRPGAAVLLAIAKSYKLDVRVLRARDLRAFLDQLKRRWTLPAALALAALLSFAFLSRLWVIEVAPLGEGVDAAEIRAALAEIGVTPGAPHGDAAALDAALLAALPDYAYLSAQRSGVVLRVAAMRALPPPDIYDPENPRDLVAARDALIENLDVLAGTPVAAPGDVVRAGQVLIRGAERGADGTERAVCALGSASARVWAVGEASLPLSETIYEETGAARADRSVMLGARTLWADAAAPFPMERIERTETPLGGLLVPLSLVRTRHVALRAVVRARDLDALQREVSALALAEAMKVAPEHETVVDKWVKFRIIIGERLHARVSLEYRVNVACAQVASVGG